ncbi:hypothetical protein BDZ89DRAFT_1036888 [Hymenopellis radicata]|nr:hypothetical protein BDZ89DRAFT_1036888 [Hymenopellis radicata]
MLVRSRRIKSEGTLGQVSMQGWPNGFFPFAMPATPPRRRLTAPLPQIILQPVYLPAPSSSGNQILPLPYNAQLPNSTALFQISALQQFSAPIANVWSPQIQAAQFPSIPRAPRETQAQSPPAILDFFRERKEEERIQIYMRPDHRVDRNGFLKFMATNKIAKSGKRLPRCIVHAQNHRRPEESCILFIKKRLDQDIFCCPIPNCLVIFIIPPASLMPKTKAPALQIVELPTPPSSQPRIKRERPETPAILEISSSDEEAPKKTTAKIIKKRPTKKFKADTEPPQPLPDRFEGGAALQNNKHQSLFGKKSAEARAIWDRALVHSVVDSFNKGEYQNDPRQHPTWSSATPALFRPYDPETVPQKAPILRFRLQFIDGTSIGDVIKSFCSLVGCQPETYAKIVQDARRCNACLCSFSTTGYNAHIYQGNCGNWPMPVAIRPFRVEDELLEELSVRTYSDTFNELAYNELQESASSVPADFFGFAWSDWHSRLGVPYDVWVLMSTGVVRCEECSLVRTLAAHRSHLNAEWKCTDLGQNEESHIAEVGEEEGGIAKAQED